MSNNRFDVGIIGAGVAGAFAALRIAQLQPSVKTIIFDLGRPPGKRRRQLEGWLGCLPAGDGKIYTGDLDKVLKVADGRKAKPVHKWVMDIFQQANPMKFIQDSTPSSSAQKRLEKANLQFKLNDYYQWKPDSIHQLSRIISEQIESVKNVQVSFDNEVHKITKQKGVFTVNSAAGDFICKTLIVCVGRSGWRWVNKLYKELGLAINDDIAKFGVRIEISSQYMKDFNKSHCTLFKDSLEIGPLSWNGTVIPEDHADLVLSSFRSNEERWKTDKVSFSLLASKTFKDAGCYQAERLAKLSFLLFNDRVSKERVRFFVKGSSQLCLLPEYVWLKEVLEDLEKVIPNILGRGYMYVPNISPIISEVKLGSNLESEVEGMFCAGESAGISGIGAAALMGGIAADSACKR